MKKRRNDTHKLEANDEKDAREPKLLPDEELTEVTGGGKYTFQGYDIPLPTVLGEPRDQTITLMYPPIGEVTWTLKQISSDRAFRTCGICGKVCFHHIPPLEWAECDTHSLIAHLGDEGDGQGRYQ
ncbi:MAG: hypothetical protein LBJ95_04155 [Oscillospiraceae bacterium]|jgi:hypothetical protein|nr:hypothetical protein [Oscillospiraceae bacterium]